MPQTRVTIYNEYVHEKLQPQVAKVYPKGIHGAISEMLAKRGYTNLRIATVDMPENGLTEEVLNDTDVLIWWGHLAHDAVLDEVAQRVAQHVREGMGLIALHSSHNSKPFKLLMGTNCRLKWRENDEKERLWVVEPGHPIAHGIPECIELPQEETYGERFNIPKPDAVVFISWFSGGEVFRSGCTFTRDAGKIFYFRPGHEEYPTYYREDITQILVNAIEWAKPSGGPKCTLGRVPAREPVPDKMAGASEERKNHQDREIREYVEQIKQKQREAGK
jgi:trehalose utilization protein